MFTVNNCKACWLLTIINNCPHPLDVFHELSACIPPDLKTLLHQSPLQPEEIKGLSYGSLGFEIKENDAWVDVKLLPSDGTPNERSIEDTTWDTLSRSSRESSIETTLDGFLPCPETDSLNNPNKNINIANSGSHIMEKSGSETKDKDCDDRECDITKILAKVEVDEEGNSITVDDPHKSESNLSSTKIDENLSTKEENSEKVKLETKSAAALLSNLKVDNEHAPINDDNKDSKKMLNIKELEKDLKDKVEDTVDLSNENIDVENNSPFVGNDVDIDDENESSTPPEMDDVMAEMEEDDADGEFNIPMSSNVEKFEEESVDDPGVAEENKKLATSGGRSRRKKRVEYYTKPKAAPPQRKTKGNLYGPDGKIQKTGKDLCDCLLSECPGCHFPCPKCRSPKCGNECRVNRRWYYEKVEVEGTKICFFNRFVPRI